jgi:enamine deaminase RidA (YjgF/YER057c/UK114 family)
VADRQRWAISSGSHFEELAGYSRAIVDRDFIFVSGTAGYDFATGQISNDAEEQTRQALRTIVSALEQAGASLADVVRVRVFIPNRGDIAAVSGVLAKTFSDPRPTNTTIVCNLAEEEMKVELEVTALKQHSTSSISY